VSYKTCLRTAHFLFAFLLLPAVASAGEADVVDVKASCNNDLCDFSATVAHDDQGWDHYANHWRLLDADGNELGRRELAHPHENEQPFTRSLGGVEIPLDITTVVVEAHDSVHEYGGETFSVELNRN